MYANEMCIPHSVIVDHKLEDSVYIGKFENREVLAIWNKGTILNCLRYLHRPVD